MLPLMLFAILATAPGPEPDLDQLRRNFEAGQVSNRESRRRSFLEQGFRPLAELTAEGREVRRLIVNVWLPGRRPGIEIERRRDGSVALSLIRPDAAPISFDVSRETWSAIESHDDAFRRPEFDMADYERRRQLTPMSSCHATWFHFESTGIAGERSAGAWACPNGLDLFTPAKVALIEAMVGAALATQEACREDEPSRIDYAYHNCFVRPGAGLPVPSPETPARPSSPI